MTVSGYQKQLDNPRWIAKRDEILKRDKYTCTCCGSKENLIIHHTYYIEKKTLPWDYPNKSLLTLCKKCHNEYHYTHELTILKKHKYRYKSKYKPQMSLAQKVANIKREKERKRKYTTIKGRLYKL